MVYPKSSRFERIFFGMKKLKEGQGCRLIVDCPDKRGVVAKVSACLSDLGPRFWKPINTLTWPPGTFFMRYEVDRDAGASSMAWSAATLRDGLSEVSEELGLNVRVSSMAEKPKVALLATKASHCLVDVLQRWRSGELHCDIACVIANHPKWENTRRGTRFLPSCRFHASTQGDGL